MNLIFVRFELYGFLSKISAVKRTELKMYGCVNFIRNIFNIIYVKKTQENS